MVALTFSNDGVNFFAPSGAAATTAVGTAQAVATNQQWLFCRAIVSSAGSGITLGELTITGVGR